MIFRSFSGGKTDKQMYVEWINESYGKNIKLNIIYSEFIIPFFSLLKKKRFVNNLKMEKFK